MGRISRDATINLADFRQGILLLWNLNL
uniref:Uncharacterized protein n=1 Tax=Anguilla anguilla TaxID=7936 RepID=A0A0E9UW36_ANGAN